MKEKVCGVTGHREIPAEYMEQAEQGLRCEIEKAIADGYTYFISALLTVQISYLPGLFWKRPKIIRRCAWRRRFLTATAISGWWRDERTRAMLEACAKVEVISEEWASNVYMKRNRYMVGQADGVIAVYDGRENGGTVSTIRMVHAQRKEMREVPVGPYLPESMINLGYFRNASGR